MTAIEITFKEKKFKFRDKLTFKEYMDIQDNYPEATEIEDETWWFKKTPFGEYFLINISLIPLEVITEKEWKNFYPIFRKFFPTTA